MTPELFWTLVSAVCMLLTVLVVWATGFVKHTKEIIETFKHTDTHEEEQ